MNTDTTAAGSSPVERGVRPAAVASWCVVGADTGMTLAKGSAPTEQEAVREAAHYAVQYAQEEPVRWWVRVGRKTVLRGSLACVSITRTLDIRHTLTA